MSRTALTLKFKMRLFLDEETDLRKADRTVGVNCNVFSNISSGTV